MKTYRVKVKHLSFKKPAVSVYEIQAESCGREVAGTDDGGTGSL